jgi:hypothetical protein
MKKAIVKIELAYLKYFKIKIEKRKQERERDVRYVIMLEKMIMRRVPREDLNEAARKI